MNQEDIVETEELNNDDAISSDLENNCVKENKERTLSQTPKRFLKNIAMVLFSNIFSILSGILVGFIIPKMMDVSDYGYYKAFSLYTSYIGLLHLGFIDGIYLKFAGKSFEDLNKEKFRFYFKFIFALQLLMTLIVLGIAFFFINTNYFLVLVFVALDIIAVNLITYYEFISQITLQFKKISIRNILRNSFNIIAIAILYVLYRFNDVVIYNYIYVSIVVGINYVMAIWYIISYRDLSFGKSANFREAKADLVVFFKVGIQLLLANLIGQLMFIVDQQVVNIFFDNETYASYAFAYTMINLITIATSAISVVLYPTLKTMNEETVKQNYSKINSYLLIFVSLCLLIYFPLDLIIRTFLPKYIDSLQIFIIILPGVLISSSISVIKYNCYKTFNKIRSYFIKSLVMLIVAIVADVIVYIIFKNTMSISIVSIAVLLTWYIIVEFYFINTFKVKWIRNLVYMILMIGGFYASTFIPNIYLAGVSYLGYYLVVTIIIYFDVLKNLLMSFKNYKLSRMR